MRCREPGGIWRGNGEPPKVSEQETGAVKFVFLSDSLTSLGRGYEGGQEGSGLVDTGFLGMVGWRGSYGT